jgi:hypothetical protein
MFETRRLDGVGEANGFILDDFAGSAGKFKNFENIMVTRRIGSDSWSTMYFFKLFGVGHRPLRFDHRAVNAHGPVQFNV